MVAAFIACAPLPATAKQSEKNDQILKATDPYEGLAEAGIDGDAGKIKKGLKAAGQERIATRGLLSPDAANRFDALFALLTAAQAKHNNIAVSLAAAELYKVLVSSLDPTALTVPMEVSLLDYCGFRTHALLKETTPDWKAIAATAHEANGFWAKVRDRVTDTKIHNRMDVAQQGMTAAAEKHDAALSHLSAKDNLDLVDELEGHFEKK